MPLFFSLFVLVPLVELWLLVQVGGVIGAPTTIAIVVGTAFLGVWLARREGLKALREFTTLSQRGEMPTRPMFDAFAVFVGGALLIVPGLMTDIIGLALLLSPCRNLLRRGLSSLMRRRLAQRGVGVETFTFGEQGGDASSPGVPFEGDAYAGGFKEGRPHRPGRVVDATFDD